MAHRLYCARVAKSADAKDLKSVFRQRECGFKSRPGHHTNGSGDKEFRSHLRQEAAKNSFRSFIASMLPIRSNPLKLTVPSWSCPRLSFKTPKSRDASPQDFF